MFKDNNINFRYLEEFKKEINKHKNNKFVIVCGGGKIARDYITALEKEGKSKNALAEAGIRATRTNALFLMQFFGKEANESLPMDMISVQNDLKKHRIVICGALRFSPNSTSDSTAAKLSHFLKGEFVNITNVPGLYTSDPKSNPSARLIKSISWSDFDKIASKIKFHAGQHFVLDQQASKIIKKHKIKTYITDSPKYISNIINSKSFIGTIISD